MIGPDEMMKLERGYSEIMEGWWSWWSAPPYTGMPGMKAPANAAALAASFEAFEAPVPPKVAYHLARGGRGGEIAEDMRVPITLFEGLIGGYVGDRPREIDRRLYARVGHLIKGALADDMRDLVAFWERRSNGGDDGGPPADFDALLAALDAGGIGRCHEGYELYSTFARTMGLLLDWLECADVGLDHEGRLPSYAEAVRAAEAWRDGGRFGLHLCGPAFLRFPDGRAIHWVGSVEGRVRLGHLCDAALLSDVWPRWDVRAPADAFVLVDGAGTVEVAFTVGRSGEPEQIWPPTDVNDPAIVDHARACATAYLVIDHCLRPKTAEERRAFLETGIPDGHYAGAICTVRPDDPEFGVHVRQVDIRFEDGAIVQVEPDLVAVVTFRSMNIEDDEVDEGDRE